MTDLLIATTNPGKIVEIQDLLEGLPFRLLLPADLGIRLEVEETGQTYAENAALKAVAYCAASGILTLADDSGLEVAALDGAPGLHSARYSPHPGAKDADRRALLLRNLTGKPQPWLARFVCAVVIAAPGAATAVYRRRMPRRDSARGTRQQWFWLRPDLLPGRAGPHHGRVDPGREEYPQPPGAGCAGGDADSEEVFEKIAGSS